ncbi:hypothetical protein DFJ77DRAFT_283392 [Powellomyces hirtus]|nr:hypothetical protein DFJ77DRAFT_283392 [Powellomyces hirtus]
MLMMLVFCSPLIAIDRIACIQRAQRKHTPPTNPTSFIFFFLLFLSSHNRPSAGRALILCLRIHNPTLHRTCLTHNTLHKRTVMSRSRQKSSARLVPKLRRWSN